MLEKELHYFLALAQTRNFTRAAEKMYVTQPAFSRKIAELEEETGCQLIVRKTRPIELTPAGEIFLKWATVLAGDLEQMEEAMARASPARCASSPSPGRTCAPAAAPMCPPPDRSGW